MCLLGCHVFGSYMYVVCVCVQKVPEGRSSAVGAYVYDNNTTTFVILNRCIIRHANQSWSMVLE